MSSAVRSFTKIYKRNFEISWNFYKKSIIHAFKAGLNAKKFATFWIFPKRIYHSFVLQMTRNTIKKKKYGGWKSTKTSGVHFFYKSYKLQILKMVKLLKIKRRGFFQRHSIPTLCQALGKLGSSKCCNFEMKHATGL